MAKPVEAVLHQVLEAQMSEHLGATMHERSEERQGYRNGTRVRTLYTRVGPVSLQVPQARDGSFSLALPEKYRLRLRTTNMQERLNEEVRRRERVIRIFPNASSALRLIGALMAEHHEAWQERKYWKWALIMNGRRPRPSALERA